MTAIATPATALDWEQVARAGMHDLAIEILLLIESADGEWTPKDLADHLGQPIGNVSYHVRMLACRGLLRLVRTEPRRGAVAHFYTLADGAVA